MTPTTRSTVLRPGAWPLAALALVAIGADVRSSPQSPNPRIGINPWKIETFLARPREYAATNVGTIRIDLSWDQVEPQPGSFTWTKVDALVEAAHESGIDVLLTLRAISSWGTKRIPNAEPGHGASLPLDLSRWNAYVSALASRYKGRNVAYEVENEPNSAFWAGTMEDYLTLLKATHAALTAADPRAIVVSGPLACHVIFDYRSAAVRQRQNQSFDTWQRAILETRAFTVIGVHDYYFPDSAVNGWTFASFLTHVQDLAKRAGCDKCPVWITETGYVSRAQPAGARTDAGSPEKQAAWAAQAFQQAFDHGVERVYWLFLHDVPNAKYFASMGLVDAAGAPRPVYATLSRAGR